MSSEHQCATKAGFSPALDASGGAGVSGGMAVHLVARRTTCFKELERSRNLLLLLAGVPRCRRCRSWFVCRLTRGRDAGPADRGLGHRSLYVRRKRINALVDLGILGARPKGSPPSSKPPAAAAEECDSAVTTGVTPTGVWE